MNKIQNGREIHLHMNKKQNEYQSVNLIFFLFCMTWGGGVKNISGDYYSSSDL